MRRRTLLLTMMMGMTAAVQMLKIWKGENMDLLETPCWNQMKGGAKV